MLLTILALLAAAPQAASVPAKPAPTVAQAQHFIVLLRLRHDLWLRYKAAGVFPDDDKAASAALSAHVAYWNAQRDAGRAVLAGGMGGDYWDNVAIIVVRAATLEAAQKLVDADAAVNTYVFQAQVRPFTVSWVADREGKRVE